MSHSLVLAFDTENHEFARGFEAGRIFTLLERNPKKPLIEKVHAVNAEMFLRMAESLGRPVHSRELNEEWIEIHFEVVADHAPKREAALPPPHSGS